MERPGDIDPFDRYVERGDVRDGEIDRGQSTGLVDNAQRKFESMQRMGLDETTATDYVENVYEACRMLVQAFMALEGYSPYSHEAVIAYGLEKRLLSPVQASRLNKYRKLRNDIKYRGESATPGEAEDVRALFRELRDDLEPRLEEGG